MLFRITRDCDMGCTHCLIKAEPNGLHMNAETVKQSIAFIKELSPRVVMVTGGEPFGHPQIFEILEQLIDSGVNRKGILVTSNGMPLQDAEFREKALSYKVGIQVVNDARYYPRCPVINDPRIIMADSISDYIFPAGRALTSENVECTSKVPSCFNLRSIARSGQVDSLYALTRALEDLGRMCTPVIDYDGTVRIGESELCEGIGSIWTPLEQLFSNICKYKCNRCGLYNGLSPLHKLATGEF